MEAASRYTRQTSLPDFGPEGQARLQHSKVLIVGLGGLGIPVAQYLNAMGVGTLGLMDNDTIALHNLQRQVLYSENDIGKPKVSVAAQKLAAQNSDTRINVYANYLNPENALEIIKQYDLVVDATDNFGTRYLINDACVVVKKPFVYGALQGFEGQVSVFNYKDGPTYRCVFPDPPKAREIPNCNENGILGVLPGIIGTLQALEAVKVLSGKGQVLSGELLLFDGNTQQSRKIGLEVNPKNKQLTTLQLHYEIPPCETEVPVVTIAEFLHLSADLRLQLIDVRNPEEFAGNAIRSAVNIPLSKLEDELIRIDFTLPVYFICQSGVRSRSAVQIAQDFKPQAQVYSIEGGMTALPDPIKITV